MAAETENSRTDTAAPAPAMPWQSAVLSGAAAPATSRNRVICYETLAAYLADAPTQGEAGYAVVSVLETDERAGFWRGLLLSLWALVWRPAHRYLVTYVRAV